MGISPANCRKVMTACVQSVAMFGAELWGKGDHVQGTIGRADELQLLVIQEARATTGCFRTTNLGALSMESGCWNIWIDKREDRITVLCGHKISLYTGRPSGQRREDCPPEPVLGDSVMSGHLLISGRHLILTLPLVRKMQRNTGENKRNRILGCLVKTRNHVKKTLRGRNHGQRRKSASSKEITGKIEERNYFNRLTRGLSATSAESRLTSPSP